MRGHLTVLFVYFIIKMELAKSYPMKEIAVNFIFYLWATPSAPFTAHETILNVIPGLDPCVNH